MDLGSIDWTKLVSGFFVAAGLGFSLFLQRKTLLIGEQNVKDILKQATSQSETRGELKLAIERQSTAMAEQENRILDRVYSSMGSLQTTTFCDSKCDSLQREIADAKGDAEKARGVADDALGMANRLEGKVKALCETQDKT